MNFTSIDPGKTGALVRWEDSRPVDWHQFDCRGRFFTHPDLHDLMEFYDTPTAVMEMILDRHIGRQSSIANNTTAVNFGIHYGLLQSYGANVDLVSASAWKSRLELSRDKGLSLDMARELYPECEEDLVLKKHHDLAEALLIGTDFLRRKT